MLTRGKLATQSGCNIETIRYYEKVGLLPAPERSAAGYRLYGEEHARRLRFILTAKELGFSGDSIRNLLRISDGKEKFTRAEVKHLTEQHVAEISQKITDLQKLKKRLSAISNSCDGADESAQDCPIIISLYDDH